MRLVTDLMAYAQREVPSWNTISISGYHIREAGSTAVQEVAFTLANAIAYATAAVEAGLEVDDFAPRLSFFFNAHSNFLEEIAKFRAARQLWAEIMRDRFGARNPRSLVMRFHTQTAGSTLTAQQPLNNVVRVTLQALSAVLGGTQSLHTNAYDEALALPTEQSARLALRTQQILANESGVPDVADPLGGSYLIEYLTDQIASGVRDPMSRVDGMGARWLRSKVASSRSRSKRQPTSSSGRWIAVTAASWASMSLSRGGRSGAVAHGRSRIGEPAARAARRPSRRT
jgi:methylmalonyl-CoA mutase N-terminal domain/subunit